MFHHEQIAVPETHPVQSVCNASHWAHSLAYYRVHGTLLLNSSTMTNKVPFRPVESCTDALFSLQWRCESACNKHRTQQLCMLDLTAAFNSVDRGMTGNSYQAEVSHPSWWRSSRICVRTIQLLSQQMGLVTSSTGIGYMQGCSLAANFSTIHLTQLCSSYCYS